jgi:flagellar biosynthesis component FlhA
MNIYLGFKIIVGIAALVISFATLYLPTKYKLKNKKPGVILVQSIKTKFSSYVLLGGMMIILIVNQFALFSSLLIGAIFVYKSALNKNKKTTLAIK